MPDALTLRPLSARDRWRRELRAAIELWLLPGLLALLPYRIGIAFARRLAQRLPLYRRASEAGAASRRAIAPHDDGAAWQADFRFAQLVDHCDLFWALTRSRRFLLEKLGAGAPGVPAGRPLLVVSFHFGQGLWLLHWLAVHGHAPRFLSIRLTQEPGDCLLAYLYARLRIAIVERLAAAAPIYTGGARREIAATLAGGGTVYGLVDVPVPDASELPGNAVLLGCPVYLPTGLLESAAGSDAAVLVLTARALPDGSRVVESQAFPRASAVSLAEVAGALDARIARAPSAWHMWHFWPAFTRAS